MAMIKCKECKKKISSLATVCPNCGAPVQEEVKEKAKKKKSNTAGGCLVILIVTGLIIWFAVETNKTPEQQTKDQEARTERQVAKLKEQQLPSELTGLHGERYDLMAELLEKKYGFPRVLDNKAVNPKWFAVYFTNGNFTLLVDSKTDIIKLVKPGKHPASF